MSNQDRSQFVSDLVEEHAAPFRSTTTNRIAEKHGRDTAALFRQISAIAGGYRSEPEPELVCTCPCTCARSGADYDVVYRRSSRASEYWDEDKEYYYDTE